MFIETKKLCGKYFSQVRNSYADGFDILFESPEYLTEAMALADAKCWMAFHGEAKPVNEAPEKVWVPVDRGYEVELPYGAVTRIALEYRTVQNLARSGEQSASKRALRPLLDWARAEYNLTTRDMNKITTWWWEVDSQARIERGLKAVAEMEAKRQH